MMITMYVHILIAVPKVVRPYHNIFGDGKSDRFDPVENPLVAFPPETLIVGLLR